MGRCGIENGTYYHVRRTDTNFQPYLLPLHCYQTISPSYPLESQLSTPSFDDAPSRLSVTISPEVFFGFTLCAFEWCFDGDRELRSSIVIMNRYITPR